MQLVKHHPHGQLHRQLLLDLFWLFECLNRQLSWSTLGALVLHCCLFAGCVTWGKASASQRLQAINCPGTAPCPDRHRWRLSVASNQQLFAVAPSSTASSPPPAPSTGSSLPEKSSTGSLLFAQHTTHLLDECRHQLGCANQLCSHVCHDYIDRRCRGLVFVYVIMRPDASATVASVLT